jgi:hypothetical protein
MGQPGQYGQLILPHPNPPQLLFMAKGAKQLSICISRLKEILGYL